MTNDIHLHIIFRIKSKLKDTPAALHSYHQLTSSITGPACKCSTTRGPAIDVTSSSTSVVAVAGYTDSTPRGLAIDAFLNFGDGCCQTTVVVVAEHSGSIPQGASQRCLAELGTCRQYFSGDTYQGATAVNPTTTSKASFTKKYF
jgi:hypothetical protein